EPGPLDSGSGLLHLDAAVQRRAVLHLEAAALHVALEPRGLLQDQALARAHVVAHAAADHDGARAHAREDLAALADHQRVLARDLAAEHAVDADRVLEAELALELRALVDEGAERLAAGRRRRRREAARFRFRRALVAAIPEQCHLRPLRWRIRGGNRRERRTT